MSLDTRDDPAAPRPSNGAGRSAPDPDSAYLQELSVLVRKLRTLFDARASALGLTFARARVFLHMARLERPTQSELAEALEVERPTMARLLDGMEKAGLVTRELCKDDRRARRIVLTQAAEAPSRALLDVSERLRSEVLNGVSPEDLAVARRVALTMLSNLAKLD